MKMFLFLLACFIQLGMAAPRDPSWKEAPFFETAPEPVLAADESTRGFMLFTRPITEVVYPQTRPLGFERTQSLEIFATPGEFEPALLGVYPTKDIRAMRVVVTDLVAGKEAIPAANIEVRHGRYVDQRFPLYTTKGTFRRVVELLEKGESFSFPAKECQQWWLIVRVPEGSKPGYYLGKVTVTADGVPPVTVTLGLRVLPFALLKDPSRHYSAYHYDLPWRQRNTMAQLESTLTNEESINKISLAEYRTMADFGLDMPPTHYLSYDGGARRLFSRSPGSLELMGRAGLLKKGPMLAVMQLGGLFQKHTGSSIPPHAAVTNEVPQAFFDELTEITVKFEAERKEKGWPEFIYNPLDEVDASAWEFGVKTHLAVKKAGVRVYSTKDPKGFDAVKYAGCIDVWCSQPFSVSYDDVVKDKNFRYWSYPNHNSGEIKSREVMMKGGRMTYGYGFWRSGYEGLVPWIWRWDVGDPNDYLDGNVADTGNKLDPRGEMVPAVYWVCFREGIDDARYIYTLQQAIVEREKSTDPACMALVFQGKQLLQNLWDAISVQEKYLASGMWPSGDFQGRRWQAAKLIEALKQFPGEGSQVAPSVLVARTKPLSGIGSPTTLDRARAEGLIEERDLGDEDFSGWKNLTAEGRLETVREGAHRGSHALRWTVRMDHQSDGESGTSGTGKYQKGWPRLLFSFPEVVDLSAYDYVSLMLRIDSDRDEVADDNSPFNLDIITTSGKYQKRLVGEAEQRSWISVVVPVSELATLAGDPRNIKELKALQLWIPEGAYPDKSTVTFLIDRISLLRLKRPVLDGLEAPSASLLPLPYLPLTFGVLGGSDTAKGLYRVRFSLFDEKGSVKGSLEQDLGDYRTLGLPLEKGVLPGKHRLQMDLMGHAGTLSSESRPLLFLEGPSGH